MHIRCVQQTIQVLMKIYAKILFGLHEVAQVRVALC
jgi:hypothetical protein